VKEDPSAVDEGEGGALLAGAKGGEEAEKEADGEQEDAEGDGLIAPVDDEEGDGEEEAEKGLGFVSVDGEAVMGGVEHLGERDKVEEDGGDGGRDGDVAPAGTVVEGRRQDCERSDAVEENRDFEPQERHTIDGRVGDYANFQYIVLCRALIDGLICLNSMSLRERSRLRLR
jgi:hypothetical protein